MKLLISLVIAALGFPVALAQVPSTVPMVLGCSNPAPAAAGKPTVFIAKCITPVFVPTSTTSVVGTGSKAAPLFQHTFSYYVTSAPTIMLVACPKGAVVSGASCTANGADASALVASNLVSAFVLTPVTPPPATCPDTFLNVTYTCTVSTDQKTVTCTAPTGK